MSGFGVAMPDFDFFWKTCKTYTLSSNRTVAVQMFRVAGQVRRRILDAADEVPGQVEERSCSHLVSFIQVTLERFPDYTALLYAPAFHRGRDPAVQRFRYCD